MLSQESIRANLPVAAVPSVPEIHLHQAGPRSGLSRLGKTPYWAHCWAGGLALARYVLDHPDVVRGQCVLDLGAGSGLASIAAAKAGAAKVLAADSDANALVAVEANAALNAVRIETRGGDPLDAPPLAIDLVLAGDVFYDVALARRMIGYLDRCRASGAEVLIGDPWRKPLPLQRLCLIADYFVPDYGSADCVQSSVFALVPVAEATTDAFRAVV